MSESRIAQLTKVPFGQNEPLLHRALEAGAIGLWDFFPCTGQIDLYHNVISFQTLKAGRYYGPVSEFTQHVLADDAEIIARLLGECALGLPAVEAEFRILTAAGNVVWLKCRGQNTVADDGSPRYVGTLADVTHSAERELRLLAYHDALFSLARNPLVDDRADFLKAAKQIISQAATSLKVARGGLWQFSAGHERLHCWHQYDARGAAPAAATATATATDSTDATRGVTLLATDYPAYFAAISQRRSLAVENAMTDPVLSEFRATYLPQTGVKALLDVPVFHQAQLWGVVCFEDCEKNRAWDSDAAAFASSAVDLLALAYEVSQRAKSEAELASTRERHRAFIQASHDSIWSVNVETPIDTTLPPEAQIAALRQHACIDDANESFIRDYQLDPKRVIGRRLFGFMPELFKGTSLRDWIDRGYRLSERELRLRVKGAEHHWLSLSLIGVVEEGKLVRIWGARRNITDRKRYQSLLEHLAFRDPLTGLLNRQRLVSEVNELIDQGSAHNTGAVASLLLLDLNQFKDVNDTLGHGAGDEVLRQMKARFDSALVNENAIAARLGGDEFGVFVRDVGTAEGAMRVGQAITDALAAPFIIGGGKFHVSASIGAAIYPTHGTTFSELSRSADEAMYHAKQTGGGVRLFSRNTVVFERRKLLLLADLPEAIDRGELMLEYQPIINCLTRRPVRMEALVRWNHPKYGRLTAQDFVYKAEMSDSIRVLTRWVIEQALQAARDWQPIAPGIGVAINISPRLLGDSSVVAHLQASIQKFGLSARLVDLEITETSLIHNPDRAAQILADCRALGFSIVVDDYGVGFCSLAYLRRLPLKGLKIDASFVSRVTESAEDAVIVQSTITLAHNLGLTVVAEGVEDAATLGFLEFHGCDFAQGFDISRPMDIASTLLWLQSVVAATPAPAAGTPPLRVVS